MKRISLLSVAIACLITALSAQEAPPSQTAADRAAAERMLASRRDFVRNAHTSAMAGDPVGAEQHLYNLVLQKPNTSIWHLGVARRLVHLANDVIAAGGRTKAMPLVSSAFNHLARVEVLSKDTKRKAAGKATEGHIHEILLRDIVKAKASYDAALALTPSDPSISEAVTRLDRAISFARQAGGSTQ